MNKIETIKIGDIEVPVEYLRQTTVNVNGDDYIRLQQENEQLKSNWNKLKDYIVKEYYMYLPLEASTKSITILIDKMKELEGSDK